MAFLIVGLHIVFMIKQKTNAETAKLQVSRIVGQFTVSMIGENRYVWNARDLKYANTIKESSNADYVLAQLFANMANVNLAVVNVVPNHFANTENINTTVSNAELQGSVCMVTISTNAMNVELRININACTANGKIRVKSVVNLAFASTVYSGGCVKYVREQAYATMAKLNRTAKHVGVLHYAKAHGVRHTNPTNPTKVIVFTALFIYFRTSR